ncbi:MAG TPA: proton-conducting transporter membrane subunit, partial [Edaphobacter sp.]
PVTFWTMTAGVVAIAGIPPLAGFFSKDEILFRVFTSNNPIGKLLWFVGLVTAGMTSFYMFRLWFKTFFGEERFEEHADLHDHGVPVHAAPGTTAVLVAEHESHAHGVHESPLVMTGPLMILAVLSVIGGWVGIPFAFGGSNEVEHFLEPVLAAGIANVANHSLELTLAAVSVLVSFIGFYIAYLLYYKKPGTASAYAERFPALYRIVLNKFYIDEIYQTLIVTPLLMFSRLILGTLVDAGIINGSAHLAGTTTRELGSLTRRIQSGNIRSYAGWLALGAAAVMFLMIFGRTLWSH